MLAVWGAAGRDDIMVRIGIVGAGGIARRHVHALTGVDDARLTAVVDTSGERAAQLAASCEGASAFETVADGLDAIDAAFVLTPPQFHRDVAVAAIEAGKHVMIEKPLAVDVADGEAIVAAARKHGVVAMTAFNMRFRPGFAKLRDAISGGCLGEVVQFWSQRLGGGGSHDEVEEGANWRTTSSTICGMTIESLSHDIDLVRWMLGDVAAVKACTRASHAPLPGFDDNASLVLTLASGAFATIHASWSSWLGFNSRGAVGTAGAAMVAGGGLWDLDRFHLRTKDMPHESIEVLNETLNVDSYRAEDRHFVECIRNDTPPSVTAADGLAALKVSRAALTSSRDGKSVRPR